MASHIRRNSAI